MVSSLEAVMRESPFGVYVIANTLDLRGKQKSDVRV
jgi:hypothetical protein